MLFCQNCKYFFPESQPSSFGTCVKRVKYIYQASCATCCEDYADKDHDYLIEDILAHINNFKINICSKYHNEHEKCPFFQRHKDYNDCTFHFYMKALLEIEGVKEMDKDESEDE